MAKPATAPVQSSVAPQVQPRKKVQKVPDLMEANILHEKWYTSQQLKALIQEGEFSYMIFGPPLEVAYWAHDTDNYASSEILKISVTTIFLWTDLVKFLSITHERCAHQAG